MDQKKSPREVACAIRADFRAQNLNIQEAAHRCGCSPATLSTTLARDKYLGKIMATRLAETFNYDISFLYSGVGELRKAHEGGDATRTPSAIDLQLRQILSVCVGLSAAVGYLQQAVAELSAKLDK